MADLLSIAEAEGMAAIDSFLAKASELDAMVKQLFPGKTLEEVHAGFAKEIGSAGGKPGVNGDLAKAGSLLREQAAAAIADFKKAEMWIVLKTPAVSDGNNFGVEVQAYVGDTLKTMRQAMQTIIDTPSTYHWQRGLGLEKVPATAATKDTTVSSSEDSEEKEGKTTTTKKSSTKTDTKSTEAPVIADFVEYTAALDTKQYHTIGYQLNEITNYYLKAHLLFEKNAKRLADPRGEGEGGGGGNVMSMF